MIPTFKLHIHCLLLPLLAIDSGLWSGLVYLHHVPSSATHFGLNCWLKSSGVCSLAAALYLPRAKLWACVWLEICVVCFIQDGKIMKLVFGKGLCNIISLQRRYLRRFMKRRYRMSPVSFSMRHTIKINEERSEGIFVALLIPLSLWQRNILRRTERIYTIDVIRVFSHWLHRLHLFVFKWVWSSPLILNGVSDSMADKRECRIIN